MPRTQPLLSPQQPSPARPSRRTALVLLGAAALLAVANVLLIGLPGAVLLVLAEPLAHLVSDTLIGGDAVWPAAIVLGLLAPFTVPIAYLAVARLAAPPRTRGVAMACLAGLACLAAATATQGLGAR